MQIAQLQDRLVLTGDQQDRALFGEIVRQARMLPIYAGPLDVTRLRNGAVALADSPLARQPHAGTTMTPVDAKGASAWLFHAPSTTRRTPILYFHGGGFVCGSVRIARGVVSSLVHAFCAPVLAVAYRQAPEHAFPAALEDARASYAWLVERSDEPITIIGESAGGALALSAALYAAEHGLRPARAVIAMSAWFDMAMQGASWFVNRDDLVTRQLGLFFRDCYLGAFDPQSPAVSPLNQELTGAPPLLVQVGGSEVALDDALRLAAKARAAGVGVQLEIYADMPHGFVKFANPIGDIAITRMADWEAHVGSPCCARTAQSIQSSS